MAESGTEPMDISHAELDDPPRRRRPLLVALIALSAGIVAARYLPVAPWQAIVVGIAACAALAAMRRRLGAATQSALILVLIAATGLTLESLHLDDARRDVIPGIANDKSGFLCAITGTLSGEVEHGTTAPPGKPAAAPPESLERTMFRIDAEQVETNGATEPASGVVRVMVHGAVMAEMMHGDRVTVFGWLRPLAEADRFSVSRGYAAMMSVDTPDAVRRVTDGGGSFLRAIYRVKAVLRQRIGQSAALTRVSPEAPALINAMLLGDREELRSDLTQDFNQSGTTHILAISGLHLAIVYATLLWLCRMLLIRGWVRRVIVIGLIVAYSLITGLGPAVTRAMLMVLMFEIADTWKLYREPVNTVAACALVILAVQPHYLFEAGFQLTFVAVFGILAFSGDLKRLMVRRPDSLERLEDFARPNWRRRLGRWTWDQCAGAIAVSGAASLAVAPIQAYFFDIVTPVSIFATALLVPVILLLIGGGFLYVTLGMWVPWVGGACAWALSGLSAAFAGVAEVSSRLPGGHVYVNPPPVVWVLVFYAALILVAARKRLRIRTSFALAAPVLVWAVYAAARLMVWPGPDFAVTMVDVRHGASTIVTRGRTALLFDCGSGTPMSTYDVGRREVVYELWREGVRRIDVLVLSHPDADHVNGVRSLAERIPIAEVVVARSFDKAELGREVVAALRAKGTVVHEVAAGEQVNVGDIHVKFLWPPEGESAWRLAAVNDRSLVARVECGGRSILVTSDAESSAIGGLLSTNGDLRSDLLSVPHHGSNDPFLKQLVAAVRPEYSLVSREPDPPMSSAVKEGLRGTRVLMTPVDGTVRLVATPRGWRVERPAARDR